MSKTILRLGSRKSDLARIQAYTVGEALQQQSSDIQVEYVFSESFGDQNLDLDLKASDSKGLFTQDFIEALQSGDLDLVVHSWKDLPIEDRSPLKVIATFPREDSRDFFLIKKKSVERLRGQEGELTILSSSPRREYNLTRELPALLPFEIKALKFIPIRGNIPTRFTKFMESDCDGLVVAKAALDRMLSAQKEEFVACHQQLRGVIDECEWMVLPLSLNPCAPAQGALAIEARADNSILPKLLEGLHCANTFAEASKERQVLKSYGGGCHQKIGVSHQIREFGVVETLAGLTEAGEVLSRHKVLRSGLPTPVAPEQLWPQHQETHLFDRKRRDDVIDIEGKCVWVSKGIAWPDKTKGRAKTIWTSGVKCWKTLAQQGLWVNGSADSLGENDDNSLNILLGHKSIKWSKFGHSSGIKGDKDLVVTYDLIERNDCVVDFDRVTHFFWMSYSSFLKISPSIKNIKNAHHACGAGHTYNLLKRDLGPSAKIEVFLNFKNWYKYYTGGES